MTKEEQIKYIQELSSSMMEKYSRDSNTEQEKYLFLVEYYSAMKSLSETFEFFSLYPYHSVDVSKNNDLIIACFSISAKIKVLDITTSEKKHSDIINSSINLDENWRSRIRSYVDIIKKEIEKTDIKENIRNKILSKLNQFLFDLDKTKTNLDSFNEAFLEFTYAVGVGYENLRKPIALFRKVIHGLSAIRSIENNGLPSPEEMKLLPPPDSTESE